MLEMVNRWLDQKRLMKQAKRLGVPFEIEKHFATGNRVRGVNHIPVFDGDSCYIRHETGDIVPMSGYEGFTPYYEIVNWSRYGSGWGDYASWDDRKQYDLRLVRIEFDE